VLIDTTLGVVLIAYLLKLAKYVLVDRLQLEGFDMGVYKTGKMWNCWVRLDRESHSVFRQSSSYVSPIGSERKESLESVGSTERVECRTSN